jgi:hypothetical protein
MTSACSGRGCRTRSAKGMHSDVHYVVTVQSLVTRHFTTFHYKMSYHYLLIPCNIWPPPPHSYRFFMYIYRPKRVSHSLVARCSLASMQSFMKTVVTDMMPNRIEEMGFKGILKLAARSLDNRDFLSWPMDRFDPDNMRTELQHILYCNHSHHMLHLQHDSKH